MHLEGFVSLYKYYIWADFMRSRFYESENQPEFNARISDVLNRIMLSEKYIYMSYWYAGLYVVISGWKTLQLQDDKINELLKSPNAGLLYRYRNAVFHFQRNYFHDKFMKFLKQGEASVEWVSNLHEEFGRYFHQHAAEIKDKK